MELLSAVTRHDGALNVGVDGRRFPPDSSSSWEYVSRLRRYCIGNIIRAYDI